MAAKGSRSGSGQKTSGAPGRPPGGRPGPSKAVYRRRRLVVTVLALLLAAALVWAGTVVVGALAGDKDASEPFQTVPTAAAPSPPSSAAPKADAQPSVKAEEGMCPAAAVKVAASTDSEVYAAGSNPLLTLSVTNTGSEPCKINVGTTQMEFVVTSGSDRIFSSADCQDGGKDLLKEFEPGATETANFTWERLRSAPGCTAVSSNPNPGWYVFTARLGEAASEKAVFQLD